MKPQFVPLLMGALFLIYCDRSDLLLSPGTTHPPSIAGSAGLGGAGRTSSSVAGGGTTANGGAGASGASPGGAGAAGESTARSGAAGAGGGFVGGSQGGAGQGGAAGGAGFVTAVDPTAKIYIVFRENLCRGAFVSNRWILTIASCFGSSWAVGPGETRLSQGAASEVRITVAELGNTLEPAVAEVWRHPARDPDAGTGMNVALVELAEPVPFASVPPRALPGGRRPFLPGSTESWVGTHLLIDTGNTFGLRIEEATPDSLVLSSLFAPCEAIPGTPIRWSSYFFDSHYAVPLTEMLVGPLSTESCQDGYRAEVAAGSSLASWVESMLGPPYANVELTYWRPTSAYLSPSPLGNQLNALTGFAPYGTSQNHCYYLESTYDLEPARDFVTLRETRLSGSGEFRTHQCGLLPVYVETDAKNASVGVTFEASHPFEIDRSDLEGEECHITDPEGWPGCEHPCAVCVELLQDYPAYFDNNPRCALDTACGGEPYTPCSPRCPPPSEADR